MDQFDTEAAESLQPMAGNSFAPLNMLPFDCYYCTMHEQRDME